MAYAAVISLKQTIQRFIDHINPNIRNYAYEELGLLKDLDLLKETLTRLDVSSNSSCNRTVINLLDVRIREAASILEDAFESYEYERWRGNYSFPPPPQIQIDLFRKTVVKLKEKYDKELENPLPGGEDEAAVSAEDDSGGRKSGIKVSLKDQFGEIVNELMDLQSKLKILSLYGMAGIGKSHLAGEVYQLATIIQEFDLRIWVRIGAKFRLKNVLADVAAQIDHRPVTEYINEDTKTLSDRVYKSLSGQRYFIVLDDIWSTAAWDALKRWFPVEQNGSRILLTTRLEEAAVYPTTSNNAHQIRFLSNDESWELLWRNVFAPSEEFPSYLEKAGRKIAENCEGLPLLILEVADILRGHEKTEEFWMEVANMKTHVFLDAYEKISEVLSLSFEYLPQYLKACFLYMGVFPRNSEIPTSKIMDLWTIEGFIEPIQPQALEVFAMNCLKNLVSQSLAIVCERSSSFGIKSSKLHSAYWHLCVKEARKNKFLHVLNNINDGLKGCIEAHRRLSVHNILLGIIEVYDSVAENLMTRSLLCTGTDHQYPVPICFNLTMLKVLDALAIRFYEFPKEVVKLFQLRYLALTSNGKVPFRSIQYLQQLQCLILRCHHNIKFVRYLNSTCLPDEIWRLKELRHLRIMGSNLPYRYGWYNYELPNLTTLHVNARSCTNDAFAGTPKVKKLGIRIELLPGATETLNCFEHISILGNLEVVKCAVYNPHLSAGVVAPPSHLSNFPPGLRKLSLSGLGYSWEYMSIIGSLPNLQVLKLLCFAFQGPRWETKVEEFPKLEFLLLEDIELVQWTADDDGWLPRLRRLIIRNCYRLKALPSEIRAIPALKTIELVDCSPSLVACALEIKKGEENYGNFYLQVLVTSSWNFK